MRTTTLRGWARSISLVLSVALVAAVSTTLSASVSTAAPASSATAARTSAAAAALPSTSATRFGTTVFENPGESFGSAFRRVTGQYGNLGAVRVFFPKLPASWQKIQSDVGDTPVIVSFKADPAGVIAGRYDAELRRWFADAPTNRPTWWSYWHEPEDDSVNPSLYRQAWAHLRTVADAAHNAQLRSTLILMCWTLASNSHRDWRSWYPGDNVIKVLGFDCYNTGRKKGAYKDPATILDPVQRVATSLGKPWGIAELGSTVVPSGGGEQGRAQWLRTYADRVQALGGQFATYFDSRTNTLDYRLTDAPSRTTWRSVVQR
jgi:hypothetical protein